METNQDKLTVAVTLDADDFEKAIERYKQDEALLNVPKGKAPELFLHGKTYPVTQLSYQYVTDGAYPGVNSLVAEYIDGQKVKTIHIDNRINDITYGNSLYIGQQY